jgi:hypothetical protein
VRIALLPKTQTANKADTLCNIAISAGFFNCQPLRDEPANAGLLNRPLQDNDTVTIPDLRPRNASVNTDHVHKFIRKNAPAVSLRFVHGSPAKHYLDDETTQVLNISNFRTDKAGRNRKQPFSDQFEFHADADEDGDAFKIEVVDPAAGGAVHVILEALRPLFAADGSVRGHDTFAASADAAQRKLDPLDCKKVRSGVAYRSKYLRLVVDVGDKKARPHQTLLATDMVDAGDEQVEILDQKVRATYFLPRCPGSGQAKCHLVDEKEIASDKMRAKVAVHILRVSRQGAGVATIDQARQSCLKYVREVYAQANLGLAFVELIRDVPPPKNMFAIANANGRTATGNGVVRVRVRIDDAFDQEVGITTNVGDNPIDTAVALADAINALLPAGLGQAVASENPPLVGQAIGSADVLVGAPLTQRIRLNVLTDGDPRHPVKVARINSTTILEFDNKDSHVGTIEERVLVKNYDTGSDRIDLFVVGDFSSGGTCGEAFKPNFSSPPNRQPKTNMINSVLVFADTVVKKDFFHTTIPHEMGHVLMDCNHALEASELMGAGSPVGSNERLVNGPKRISDPDASRHQPLVKYDDGVVANPFNLLRTANTNLLSGW